MNAVPTLNLQNELVFLVPEYPSPMDIDEVPSTSIFNIKECNNCAAHKGVIDKLEKQLKKLQILSKTRLLKIKSLRQRSRRLKIQNVDLNVRLLEVLKREKVDNENLLMLECVKNNKVIERYLAKEANKTYNRQYDQELKKFAVTLHYLSPRAYNFVRDELKDVLPHPKTIAKWYQGVDCNPGFTTEAFNAIRERVTQNNGKPLYCALSIDEIAIRKLVEWDGQNYFGYANVGCALDTDDVPLAKEALTFMLTALNDTWKIPIGYFLLHSITSQQKALLVEQCLSLLKDSCVKVVTLTFDGVATNKAMCTYLGCDMSKSNSFTHDGQQVCLWPDPCHNIKLVRNAFADKKVLVDNEGNKISWHHIELLNKIQSEEGLHLGTKLKDEHVNYVKQKMKVRLATQLLSQSVADALEFCKQLGIPGFSDCDGTITFIKIFNNLFDIMNSRNMRAKAWKKALTTFNIEETEVFFSTAEAYIKTLKFEDNRTLVINSNRSTGFCGFLICMRSLIQLYRTLIAVKNSTLKYICTYKLSQDHIELFFGAIRAQCGFNNNPSARMFRAAYKKLLIHAQFKDSTNGNCIPLDKITVLNYSPDFKKRINDSAGNSNRMVEIPELPDDFADHEYILYPSSLSEYSHHVVHYIAGFVVRKLKKFLRCEKCLQSLEDVHHNSGFSLILVKDRGGLLKPSANATKTCKVAEKVLREYEVRVGSNCVGLPKHVLTMITEISQILLRTDIFNNLHEHSLDNDLIDDHRHLLIKSISQVYLNVRIHYMTKKLTVPVEKIRSFLTKSVIFSGQ